MSNLKPPCLCCGSLNIIKNGSTHHKKQKYQCKDCSRQFIENPQKVMIGDDKKTLIDRLLLEKISLAGIARSVSVSPTWLQSYVNQKYAKITSQLKVSVKKRKISSRM